MSAPTWRDYADKLTAEQVASMERFEGKMAHIGQVPQAVEALRAEAEYMAQCNAVDAQYADVPLPAGASTDCAGWARNTETGEWARPVEWATFPAPGTAVEVCIDGMQSTGGTFTRDISLYAEDCDLSAEQARTLAAVLAAAADELDCLDGREQAGGVPTAGDVTLQQATVPAIITEIGRRVDAAGGVLRLALAEADPAALTQADRTALLDLLERSHSAAGGE